MKLFLKKILPFALVFSFIFLVSGVLSIDHVAAQGQNPPPVAPSLQNSSSALGGVAKWAGGWILDLVLFLPGWATNMLLWLASWLTWASGVLLNVVIKFTVVDMSENLREAGAINNAWRVIRDVANMGFIFILLYAAIQTILGIGKETNRLIVRVIVVAVLINFSLFFTRVVIDISNVVALTFYDAIAPGVIASGDTIDGGISNSLMAPLNLTSLWNNQGSFDGSKLVLVGVIGSVLALIAAFVFFSIAIMFIIRFVVLIFVMVLSPIAFVASVLPQAQQYQKQWLEALTGQALFPPVYFLLTWVVIVISRGLFTNEHSLAAAIVGHVGSDANTAGADVSALMNFIIIIAMLLTSLSVAKSVSGKAGAGVSKWAMGGIGALTIGMAGRFGRGTIGRAGAALGDSEALKETAARGGLGGAAARLALATGRKTSKFSFDARNLDALKDLDAGKGQKGGFEQTIKDKRKKEKDFAESLGPSDTIIAGAEREMERAAQNARAMGERPHENVNYQIARREVDRLKGVDEKEATRRLTRESGYTKEGAKEYYEQNKDRLKGLKDIRKGERVENLENSPTFLVGDSPQVQNVANTVGDVIERTSKLVQPGNFVPNRGGWRVIRGIANTPGFAASKQLGALAQAARNIPEMIKAKNRAAIAEIRKGKKPVKEQLEEILKEQGEVTTPSEGGEAGGDTPQGGVGPAQTI